MSEIELQEPFATDSVPLAPEFADQLLRKGWLARNKEALYKTLAALIVVVALVLVTVFTVIVVPSVRPDAASVLQTECFSYANFSKSLQPASGCERALAGNCSTAPGVCVAFVFLGDTNASNVITGTMYRCGDPTCANVGDACRCANPALGRVTAFCRRHVAGKEYGGANFACY